MLVDAGRMQFDDLHGRQIDTLEYLTGPISSSCHDVARRHEGEVARRDEFEKAQEAIADYKLTIPAGIAPDNEIHNAFKVTSIPCVALIDSEGTVIGYGVGIQGGRDIMAQAEILLGK